MRPAGVGGQTPPFRPGPGAGSSWSLFPHKEPGARSASARLGGVPPPVSEAGHPFGRLRPAPAPAGQDLGCPRPPPAAPLSGHPGHCSHPLGRHPPPATGEGEPGGHRSEAASGPVTGRSGHTTVQADGAGRQIAPHCLSGSNATSQKQSKLNAHVPLSTLCREATAPRSGVTWSRAISTVALLPAAAHTSHPVLDCDILRLQPIFQY